MNECAASPVPFANGGTPMLATMTVEEAQLNLKDLIHQVAAGQEIIITENQQPVARLISELPKKKQRPAPGLGKGSIIYMDPDFDAPLEDFKEYMP
jgi:prevent-host-death family protein